MVQGRLQVKNDKFYMVLDLYDENDRKKQKWIATGLSTKGNKKRGEQMSSEERAKYRNRVVESGVLFTHFLSSWIEIVKSNIEITTYASYTFCIQGINKYFADKKILLQNWKQRIFSSFTPT